MTKQNINGNCLLLSMMTFGNNSPKSGNNKSEIKNNKPKKVEEIKKETIC